MTRDQARSGNSSSRQPRLDHGATGNGRVLALVSPTSAIDWLCLPHFDSPSVFARLLDRDHGGTFRVLHRGEEVKGSMAYLRNTNVLSTQFERGAEKWEVIDFAPRIPEGSSVRVPLEITRIIRPVSGQPRLSIDFDVRPDYARARVEFAESTLGVEVLGGPNPLTLFTNAPVPYVLGRREFALVKPIYLVLTCGPRGEAPTLPSVTQDLEQTITGWRSWAKSLALPTFAPLAVLRSALCLKLHAYHDTGAVIAAATTSIPEALGTKRTWDYRYCWLRDAAFVVEALRRLGHLSEGERLIHFIRDVAEAGPLQPVYGIDGRRDLPEEFLPNLRGFRNNGFVRIGNAAASQRQNDLFGEVVLCLETLLNDPRIVSDDEGGFFPLVARLVEMAITSAATKDTGIWEFRSISRHHTFSRAMCWVAARRGETIARRLGHDRTADRWQTFATREQELILRRAYNKDLGYFTQTLGGRAPDASNLLLATIGLVDGRASSFVSTVEKYERELVEHGLMLRYRNPDDFGETTSAFTICSFWWAEALALTGRLEDATRLFERLIAYANPVGLFSEDIDPSTGDLLGNFPQAYTHVGVIHAAITIGELREARDGHVRAWT
jgi:GH15 family glucan-1,4-alpha-glucosidase